MRLYRLFMPFITTCGMVPVRWLLRRLRNAIRPKHCISCGSWPKRFAWTAEKKYRLGASLISAYV